MKNIKNVLILLFAAILTAGYCSCSSDTQTNETTSGNAAAETALQEGNESAETDISQIKDDLPENLDFNGATLVQLYRNHDFTEWDILGSDSGNDVVLEAVWNRNLAVEERLNIDIVSTPTQTPDLGSVANEIKNNVLAASADYDLVTSTCNTTLTAALDPYFLDANTIPYLNFDQPWWYRDCINEASVDGKAYKYLFGSHLLSAPFKTGTLFFNKEIYLNAIDTDEDSLYNTVLEGSWTYDVMAVMTEQAYVDLDGNGAENTGDQFGVLIPANYEESTVHMIYGCDLTTHVRRDDGSYDFSVLNNERVITAIDTLIYYLHNISGVHLSDVTMAGSTAYFNEGKHLFYPGRLWHVTQDTFRDMTVDYGILPMPKLDKEQADYKSLVHHSTMANTIPLSVNPSHLEMIGAVLEATAAESYRTVMTPFQESLLKSKHSRDALSAQMIDIIIENIHLEPLDMFRSYNESLIGVLLGPVAKGENNFSSGIANKLKAAQNKFDDYVESIYEAAGN